MTLGRIDLGACRKQEGTQWLQKAEATPSLFVAVGDLGDFCPPFFVFFTRQLGHELFICFSSLTPTSWFCVSSVFMIIES